MNATKIIEVLMNTTKIMEILKLYQQMKLEYTKGKQWGNLFQLRRNLIKELDAVLEE